MQVEYLDGEVTLTFAPVDMPGMPDAAREYRNRAVTVWHCPVEPHHVGQTCGEPVFQDSFAFLGSPSRTFPLADCAGWLVVEAAELSADRHDGWRNAPLSCRQDDEGRTVASANTNGSGDGWGDSRHDPPGRGAGPPVIMNPGDKSYAEGMAVTLPIEVTGGDVTVSGLPPGLTWSPSSGMVSGMVSPTAAVGPYTVTVTADDGRNDPVTDTFTITVTVPPDSLFDSGGNFVFLRVRNADNMVDLYFVPYMMLAKHGPGATDDCPADSTNLRVSVRLSTRTGTLIQNVPHTSIGNYPYMRGRTRAIYVTASPVRALTQFTWQGGSAARVENAFTAGDQHQIIGYHNDPLGLVTRPVYRPQGTDNLPPYVFTSSTRSWYVTDSLSIPITQVSPAAPPSGYCLVRVADCAVAGTGTCG